VKITLEPVDVTARILLGVTGPAASKALATFARQELAKAEVANQNALGYATPHDTWVDGRKGASEDSVKPDGRIVYEFEAGLTNDAIEWVAAMLELHSPTGPPEHGHYAKDHKAFADGVEFDPHGKVPQAEVYVFVNIRPYARKIEGGGKRPPQSLQAPHGVYQVVAAMAQERFKRSFMIKYTFDTIAGQRNPAIRMVAR
jgi:hypothetical protein